MCLAVPAKVVSVEDTMAKVDIAGVERNVSIDLVDDVIVGDYLLVHVGFALQKIDEKEAQETMEILQSTFDDEFWRE